MNEVENLFATGVWTTLKKHLKGRIFCKVIDNTLQVSVKCYDLVFRKDIDRVAEQIVMGELTSEGCAMDIVKEYHQFVWEDTCKRYYY